MKFLLFALIAASGYLLGSINSSLVVGKFYNVDVRNYGSGNAGATNTLRTLGKTAAALTGLGDVSKGVLAVIIGWWLGGIAGDGLADLGGMIGGFASVIGHNWPVYFGFRGGKGVFTSAAVIFTINWKAGLILLGVFLITVIITRYISLGSILAAVALPIAFSFLEKEAVWLGILLAVLVIYRHRSNIKRLLSGTESKLGSKVKVEQKNKLQGSAGDKQ